ncbi:MAG: LL-diaminopimelate aminotransferase [Alphaproteobacteria bacterium]
MNNEFHALRRLPPYVFAEVNRLKAAARAAGEDVIDFGMGNPDSPSPEHVVEKLRETVLNPKTHGYSASKGIKGLRNAFSQYYKRRFDVSIDPETEVVVTLGSKEGLANLAYAISSPGDVFLVPAPSYPIHQFGFVICGAVVRTIPVTPDEKMIHAIERAVKYSIPKPTAIVLNYPNNPTSLVADLEFYKDIVKLCKKHELWVLSDLAYAEIYFDDNPPPSILQVEGAKDVAVEFASMSKTYSMAGWRIGFAAGNERLIHALTRVKSYLDYGAFTPIQVAAATALNGDQSYVDTMRQTYKKRRDVLLEGVNPSGWVLPKPQATMFTWAEIPEEFKELGSLAFSKVLLQGANVAVAPGIGFGEEGEGYVRFGLVENEQRIRQAAKNIRHFMAEKEKWLSLAKQEKESE